MSESLRLPLPNGWARATLEALIGSGGLFRDGDWVESKDQDPGGDVRLIQLADVGDGEYLDRSARFLTTDKARQLRCTFLESGDVLIARMPDPLGRACLFPGDRKRAVTVVDVAIVRTGSMEVDHRWLAWFINSPDFRQSVAAHQSGSTRKRISRNNLSSIVLPLPPAAEQKRIVEAVDSNVTRIDSAATGLRRAQRNVRRYRASVLRAACEGRLVPTEAELARRDGRDYESANVLLSRILLERRALWENSQFTMRQASGKSLAHTRWKTAYATPQTPKCEELPELPDGWAWATLDQLTVAGPQNGLYLPKAQYGSGTPILRIDDFQPDHSRCSDELQRVNASEDEIHKYGLVADDLIINRVNSPSHLGKCLLVKQRNLPALFESNMMRLHLAVSVDPNYIELYLKSAPGRHRLIANAKWAVNQASINQQDVASTPVPLPPRDEQERIVAEVERHLSAIRVMEMAIAKDLRRADRLRQSILKRAFEGKLVPQDPNDEPASTLLERIRAGRKDELKVRRRKPVTTTPS